MRGALSHTRVSPLSQTIHTGSVDDATIQCDYAETLLALVSNLHSSIEVGRHKRVPQCEIESCAKTYIENHVSKEKLKGQ